MKLKTISLDLGDTLVFNKPWGYEVISDLLKDMGYDVSAKKLFRASASIRGRKLVPNPNGNNTPSLKEILTSLGITLSDKELTLLETENRNTEKEVFLYDDVVDFLEGVRSLGLRTVLISNAAVNGKAKRHVETFDLKKYFHKLVFSFEVGRVKPDPDIFRVALGSDDIAVHLGDIYEVDVLGAISAGYVGVLIDRRNTYDEIESKFSNLRDFLRELEESDLEIREKELIKERG